MYLFQTSKMKKKKKVESLRDFTNNGFIELCKMVAFEMHRRQFAFITTSNEAFNDKNPDYNIPSLCLKVECIDDEGNCPCGMKNNEHDLDFHYRSQFGINKLVKGILKDLEEDK